MRVYAIVLLLLVHVILAGIWPTNDASRDLFLTPKAYSDDKISASTSSSSSISSSSKDAATASRRNSVKSHFSMYASSKEWRNKIDDDKRVVPTGPNPLHNR